MKRCFSGFVWGFLFLLTSCQNENEDLKKEVIAIHDEAMPKIGELKARQKVLLKKASDLGNDLDTAKSEEILELREVAKELDEAYNDMFVWMRQFEIDYEGMNDKEINTYLKDQKIKVDKVNQNIKLALERAEKLSQ